MRQPALYARLVLGVIAVSFGAILARFASEANPLAIAAWRLTIAAAAFVPIALLQKQRTLTPATILLSLLSGLALAAHFVLWMLSLHYTSVASSVLFVTTHPFFVGIGTLLLTRERPGRSLWIGMVLAFSGMVLIGIGDLRLSGTAFRGDLLALAGGLAVAVYFLIGRRVRRSVRATDYIALSYGSAAVLVLLLCAVTKTPLVGYSRSTLGFLVLLGLVPQLIGHSVFNWALKHLSAPHISTLILGEPVGASLLALLFFGEFPSGLNLIGAAIILVGITLSLWNKEQTHGHQP